MTCQDILYTPNHYLFLRVDLKFTCIFIDSVAIEFYLVLDIEILKYFCKFLVREIVLNWVNLTISLFRMFLYLCRSPLDKILCCVYIKIKKK